MKSADYTTDHFAYVCTIIHEYIIFQSNSGLVFSPYVDIYGVAFLVLISVTDDMFTVFTLITELISLCLMWTGATYCCR